MDKVVTLGVDLAKNVFAIHGVDVAGRPVVRRMLTRARLSEFVAQLPPCLIGMEASTSSSLSNSGPRATFEPFLTEALLRNQINCPDRRSDLFPGALRHEYVWPDVGTGTRGGNRMRKRIVAAVEQGSALPDQDWL